ncbi:unnamed protein product [Medioppia subpectinata]|uniref:ZNFX1 domain-containing protein n=1 Tax=Medioppia subpectinata TaxID=1979941 RepID=A0A7R9KJA3_9ACAR|nr:unnamed protein product [Medioppia subpectinata]CAG2103364.1 unnamed protein product [Medioppia subpectinata]
MSDKMRSKSRQTDSRSSSPALQSDPALRRVNSFRTDPICPTFAEIRGNIVPILRPNFLKGSYSSVERYLEVQYSLLREDLVRSLRSGIHEFMHCGQNGRRIPEIRVYGNVSILERSAKSLSTYWAKFDVSQLPPINWMFTKRLIPGSLLCLSANNFRTFCFATVSADRLVEDLANGLIQLELESESLTDEFRHIDHMKTYVMIESEVYYEAYKHNLK